MQLKPDTQVAKRQTTPLFAESTYTLQPRQTLSIASRMPHLLDHDATGIVTPSTQFEHHDSIFIKSSLSTVNNNAIGYQIINFSEIQYTITCDTHIADFKILTPEQIKHIQPVDPATLSFMIQHEDTTEIYRYELLKVPFQNPEQESYWFPTPDDPGDPTTYIPIQQRIYTELLKLKQLEKLNPQNNEASKKSFLSNLIGLTQRSAQKNDKKSKKYSLSFTTFLPGIASTSAQMVNSNSNSPQTMIYQHTVKAYQHQ